MEITVGPSPWFSDGRGCRGRNGWFKPATIEAHNTSVGSGNIIIEVRSARSYGTAPIIISLTVDDAARFGAMLERETKGIGTIEEGSNG